VKRRISILTAAVAVCPGLAQTASANWGPYGNCSYASHCYAISYRNIESYGGVLKSIALENTTPTPNVSCCGFATFEQWLQFVGRPSEWIESGQLVGYYRPYYDPNAVHPFWAAQEGGQPFRLWESPARSGLSTYSEYTFWDYEQNGCWHLWWSSGYVGAICGWPAYVTLQQAGEEVSSESQPQAWGRQALAASNGGPGGPWYGAQVYVTPGMCWSPNPEAYWNGNPNEWFGNIDMSSDGCNP
jgi:hypothetical protein